MISLHIFFDSGGKETYEYTEYVFSRLLHQLWFNIRVPMDSQWPTALPVEGFYEVFLGFDIDVIDVIRCQYKIIYRLLLGDKYSCSKDSVFSHCAYNEP